MTGLRKRLFFTCSRDWGGSADGWNRGGREAQVGCRFVGPDGPRDGSRARVMRDGSRLNAVLHRIICNKIVKNEEDARTCCIA